MVVIVFRNRLAPGAAEAGYGPTAARMLELARAMPGFISFKLFTAADEERVAIIEFDSEEHLAAWRNHPEHRAAQQRGREAFYSEYRLQILSPVRESSFKR